jgi:hypothetical protein
MLPFGLAMAEEEAQELVEEQFPLPFQVAAEYRKVLETKVGIPDWMTRLWQKLMQFSGRQVLGKDDFIKKVAQFQEQLQLRAMEARWTEEEDGVQGGSGMTPPIWKR